MYRFLVRPKWIGFHLLIVVGIVTMINLGLWQLRRLEQRQAFNANVEARYDAEPLPINTALGSVDDPKTVEWQPVNASGAYLPDEQLRIVNRSQNGRAGDNIVTPLLLDDGRILLVNRGFVPLDDEVPDAPSGPVDVTGRLHPSQERRGVQLSDPAEGDLTEAQRIDIPRLAPQLPGDVVPVYIDLISSSPAEGPGAPAPVAAPELGEGNHLSYAVQWLIFTICVAVGWVLAVKRSIRTHRQQLANSR